MFKYNVPLIYKAYFRMISNVLFHIQENNNVVWYPIKMKWGSDILLQMTPNAIIINKIHC